MGFGLIGRHLCRLALESEDVEVVALCDIGKPSITICWRQKVWATFPVVSKATP